VTLMNELHHFTERRAGKKDFVHAFATHGGRALMCDRSSAAAEHFDVGRAFLAQEADNSREKLGMPAVVTGNANRAHVVLARGAEMVEAFANRGAVCVVHY